MNLREEGRLRVLQALYDSAGTSRPELARVTGLSRATVSSLVVDMIAAGLVCEENGPAEPENRSMGRPAQPLSLNRSAAYAVGADIGHSHVRVALYDLHGSPVWDQAEVKEVDTAPQETLDLAADLIERALRECLVPRERVLGLGADIASPVRSDGALVADGIMSGWVGIRPGEELERRTGLATQLINDANAGALAEHRYGAGRGTDDMIYVRLSAGIGAGIITAGLLLPERAASPARSATCPLPKRVASAAAATAAAWRPSRARSRSPGCCRTAGAARSRPTTSRACSQATAREHCA